MSEARVDTPARSGIRERVRAGIARLRLIVEPGHRLPWLWLVLLALMTAGIEVMGGLVVFAILGVLTGTTEVTDLPVLGPLLDAMDVTSRREQVVWFSVTAALFFVVTSVILVYQTHVQATVTEQAGRRLSVRLLRGYLRMPYGFFLHRNSAELTRNTVLSARMVVTHLLAPLIKVVADVLVALGFLVLLLVAAPSITLIATVALAPLMLVVFRLVRRRITQAGVSAEEENVASLRLLNEAFQGIREIKLHDSSGFVGHLFDTSRGKFAHAQAVQQPLAKIPRVLLELSMMLFLVSWLALSSTQTDFDPSSLARVGVFAYAALRLLPATNRMITNLAAMRFGGPAVRNVQKDLTLIEENGEAEVEGPVEPYRLVDSIRLQNVEFTYEEGPRPTLREIDLTIRKGQTVGIVGETGAGKSTLLDLILGLQNPTSGSIAIDGRPLAEVRRAWQSSIGVVSQSFFISDDTLRNNIAFGVESDEIDDDRVREVVRISQLEEFARGLPDGLNSRIGEAGSRLSGGQRQRVAIARALYRDPAVLIFDEGTSALDTGTETELMRAVRQAAFDRTVILVAHRLSTVVQADEIILLVDGRIDDRGRFDELKSRNQRFAILVGDER